MLRKFLIAATILFILAVTFGVAESYAAPTPVTPSALAVNDGYVLAQSVGGSHPPLYCPPKSYPYEDRCGTKVKLLVLCTNRSPHSNTLTRC
jgi:hypothetical protein